MIDLHLLRIVFFKPVILALFVVSDKVDGYHSGDKDGTLTDSSVIEPSLYPPLYAVSVWIYGYHSRYVEGLNVYIKVSKRIYLQWFGGYSSQFSAFFLSSSLKH